MLHRSYSPLHYNHSLSKPASKFPQDIQKVHCASSAHFGNIFVSNIEAAENINTLSKYQIGAILTTAKHYQLHHSKHVIKYYKYIPCEDSSEFNISQHFDEGVNFITQTLKNTNVLVHCIAGVSRSVSMVLAYLIKEHNMTFDEAYRNVKAKRKIISPNLGFIKQLINYEVLTNKQRKPRRIEQKHKQSKQMLNEQNKHRNCSPSINNYFHGETTPKKQLQQHSDAKNLRSYTIHNPKETYKTINKTPQHIQFIGSTPNYRKNQQPIRKTKIQQLNIQLNQKIYNIRKKYDIERQMLFGLANKYPNIQQNHKVQNIYIPQKNSYEQLVTKQYQYGLRHKDELLRMYKDSYRPLNIAYQQNRM